jgi:hypothetical protein
MAVMWWTNWFGTSRYRDMMKPLDNPRSVLFQSEFCPMLFMLSEMLWFDTKCNYFFDFSIQRFLVDLYSCFHSLPLISALLINLWRVAISEYGGSTEPAVLM